MKKIILCSFIAIFAFVSCSDNKTDPIIGSDDTEAPSALTDLIVGFTTGNSATLYLTATGDDSVFGRARTYEVRYSTSIITELNFNSATQYISPNQPHVGSSPDTIVVPELLSNTKYYFAVKIGDEVPNWSPISNIVSGTTLLGGSWTVYTINNSDLLSNTVLDVQFNGAVKYIATLNGVSTMTNNLWDIIYESQTISIDTTTIIIGIDTIVTIDTIYLSTPDYANSIAIESASKTWIGTQNSGVALLEGGSAQFYSSNDSGLLTTTRDILISQNKLWVGTLANGLHSFELDGSNVWNQYDIPTSTIFNGQLNCVEVDSVNRIWTGLQLWGATVFDNSVFTNYNTSHSFTNQSVWDIKASETQILFGTDAGAFKFENNSWTNYMMSDSGLPDNVVTSVTIDNQGTFWFGTRYGLASYDESSWTVYTTSNSFLPANWINCLNVDMFGNLWIGTDNGLAMFNKN